MKLGHRIDTAWRKPALRKGFGRPIGFEVLGLWKSPGVQSWHTFLWD